MVKTIVFVIIIILLFSLQMKFIGQTRNLYRYGPQVDLFLCQKPETSNPYNFVIYDRISMKLDMYGLLCDAMLATYFLMTLT